MIATDYIGKREQHKMAGFWGSYIDLLARSALRRLLLRKCDAQIQSHMQVQQMMQEF